MLTERNSLRQSNRDVGDSTSKFIPQSLIGNERRNSAARAPSSPSKMPAGLKIDDHSWGGEGKIVSSPIAQWGDISCVIFNFFSNN